MSIDKYIHSFYAVNRIIQKAVAFIKKQMLYPWLYGAYLLVMFLLPVFNANFTLFLQELGAARFCTYYMLLGYLPLILYGALLALSSWFYQRVSRRIRVIGQLCYVLAGMAVVVLTYFWPYPLMALGVDLDPRNLSVLAAGTGYLLARLLLEAGRSRREGLQPDR